MKNILVVDDSRTNVLFVSSVLNRFGFITHTLTQPELVLQYLENNVIDLVLLDIYMPNINGVELLGQIKSHEKLSTINIVMLSAINDKHIIEECMQAGALGYIMKPVDGVTLIDKVQQIIGGIVGSMSHMELELTTVKDLLTETIEQRNAIVNTSVDSIISIDSSGIIMSFNHSATTMFGYSENEMLGQNVSILMPPLIKEHHDSYIVNYQHSDIQIAIGNKRELTAVKKDGSHFEIELSVSVFHTRTGKGFAGIIRDISSRKKMEAHQHKLQSQLEQSEKTYKELYTNAPVSYVTIDCNSGKLLKYNNEFITLFGYQKSEYEQLNISDLFDSTFDNNELILSNIMNSQRIKEVSIQLKRKDLTPLWICLSTKQGSNKTINCTLLDITQLKDTQNQLVQSQKLEALGTLAGGIAHDFNNTLAIITGNAELALQIQQDAKQNVQIKRILMASEKATGLVKQILDFSRKSPHELSPINLSQLVHESIVMLSSILPKNIEIKQQLTKNCPAIMGDKTQIHQLLTNLISNSQHAIGNQNGTISITLHEFDNHIKLVIEDSGCGFSDKNQTKIFDPFYTTREVGSGTGLGLSIVHSIIDDHGGTISIDSKLNIGTTVILCFPINGEYSTEKIADEVELSNCSGNILVVDDEPALLDIYRTVLENTGYNVTTWNDSTKALSSFKEDPSFFDCVLTDYSMPNLSGRELSEQLLEIRPNLPIIIITGQSETFGPKDAKNMGLKYLYKPIELALLVDQVVDSIVSRDGIV